MGRASRRREQVAAGRRSRFPRASRLSTMSRELQPPAPRSGGARWRSRLIVLPSSFHLSFPPHHGHDESCIPTYPHLLGRVLANGFSGAKLVTFTPFNLFIGLLLTSRRVETINPRQLQSCRKIS